LLGRQFFAEHFGANRMILR